jgi:hypothetical protein
VLIVFLLYLGKMYKPMRIFENDRHRVQSDNGYERIQEVLDIESRVRTRPVRDRRPSSRGRSPSTT